MKIATAFILMASHAALIGCGGDTPPPLPLPPPPPVVSPAISIASGDTQTIPASTALPRPLQVAVTDAAGRGVPGVEVVFSAQEKSGASTPTSVITDNNGRGTWMPGYFRVQGTQAISATATNFGSVNFSVIVTPSQHVYDGIYQCTYPTRSPTYTTYTFEIRDGSKINYPFSDSGSLDEATGKYSATIGNDAYRRNFLGSLMVDANGKASASGYYWATSHTVQGNFVEDGTFTCVRD